MPVGCSITRIVESKRIIHTTPSLRIFVKIMAILGRLIQGKDAKPLQFTEGLDKIHFSSP